MSLSKPIFTSQINRLADTFGREHFPKPRLEEIYKVVKDLPDQEFTKIVSRMVGELPIKYPPTVIQFREFAETKLKELRERGGPQGWEQVADEIAERKAMLAKLTPEEREERKRKIRLMASTLIKTI